VAKNVIRLRPKRLMQVARLNGVNSQSDLQVMTGVDRKTISKIEAGKPAKAVTMKRLADGQGTTLQHLLDGGKDTPPGSHATQSLELSQFDGKKLTHWLNDVSDPDHIEWHVSLDKVDETMHSSLLRLEEHIKTFIDLNRGRGEWARSHRSLKAQLNKVRICDELGVLIQEIRCQGVKLFGGSWPKWQLYKSDEDGDVPPIVERTYTSSRHIIISIEPKSQTSSRREIDRGEMPPTQFSDLDNKWGSITVDDKLVWQRRPPAFDDDGIPF
jgi:hypothetical protein